MSSVLASVGPLISQLSATARDTLIMKQVVADRGVFEQITAVANTIITIALTVLCVVGVPVMWNFRKSYKKVNDLLDRIYGDITPIMRHASSISDNVDFITTSIRTDVQKVNATINTANERVQRALAQAEHRLNEFNALLAVVQHEAEGVFVSTASTVRGVRSGAAAFRGRGGTDLASEELDTAELADEAALLMDDTEIEEERDGHDGNPEPAAETLPAAPRVRPRGRNRRRA
jgi:uncharacterized protein YoxC